MEAPNSKFSQRFPCAESSRFWNIFLPPVDFDAFYSFQTNRYLGTRCFYSEFLTDLLKSNIQVVFAILR